MRLSRNRRRWSAVSRREQAPSESSQRRQKAAFRRMDGMVSTAAKARCRFLGSGDVGVEEGQVELHVQRLLVELARQVHARLGGVEVPVEVEDQARPGLPVLRRHAPRLELERAARGPRLLERRVAALLDGERDERSESTWKYTCSGDPPRQGARVGGVEGQAHLEEEVLQPHEPEADRAPLLVGGPGRGGSGSG